MVIFKLFNDYKKTQREFIVLRKDDIDNVELNRQYRVLYSLYEYMSSCEWVKTDKVREKVEFLLNNNMNKVKLKEAYDLTDGALRGVIHRINKIFCDSIGDDAVLKIEKGDYISLDLSNTIINIDIIETNFQKSILNQFPKANIKEGVDLRDLKREMKFLEIYNSNTIAKRTSMLAKESLEHIIGLLSSNNPKHTYEKTLLTQLVMGEITMEELISKIDYKESILEKDI